jgi:hypothetical protein
VATAYLDLPGFKLLSILPSEFIDELEATQPGWIANQLLSWSASIDAKLRKRYAAPFVLPYPITVQAWLARIVTLKVALRRGIDPNDAQFQEYKNDADTAIAELAAAGDSVETGYDIPLREDTVQTGIAKGGSLGYSEASPYVWASVQAERGRNEDENGRGTSRG